MTIVKVWIFPNSTVCTSLLFMICILQRKTPIINLDELLYSQCCDFSWDNESCCFHKTAEFQGLKLLFQLESPHNIKCFYENVKGKIKNIFCGTLRETNEKCIFLSIHARFVNHLIQNCVFYPQIRY